MTDNVTPFRRAIQTSTLKQPAHITLLADMDRLLADVLLDNPDLEPPGMHTAITNIRTRYRTWLAGYRRHPSTRGPSGDGGAA